MTLKIVEVTQNDIDNGESAATRCPVAKALQRAFPEFGTIAVTDRWVYTSKDRFVLPDIATDFVVAFDHDRPVKPIVFQIDIDNLSLKQ